MRVLILFAVVAALGLPACSKSSDSDEGGGPSSDVRAQMQQIRNDARDASMAALSSTDKTKVQSSVTAFNSGSVTLDAAASQIDAALTPAESAAVLAQQQKMRDAMRLAAEAGSGGQWMGRRGGSRRPPDAGRFLVTVSADPAKVRAAMHRPE